MVIDVPATLPDSILAPRAVQEKFASSSLAGLGGMGTDFTDDYTPTYQFVGTDPLPPTETVDLCALYPMAGCPGGAPASSGVGPTSGPAGGGGGTDWSAVLAQALRSGTDLSKLYLIQPGTSLSQSGAITRQNPGFAIPQGAGINVGTGGGNTLLLLGVGALALFMFMSQRGH